MPNENDASPVYLPHNEPYLGCEALYWFDRVIVYVLAVNERIAKHTHEHKPDLSDLQQAACQIVPHGVSIALSIRELIRQAYLLSAQVLMRPLIERTAVISYLHANPEAVELWKDGWKHLRAPGLQK